jgi:GT2 family glycosyltransferase
MMDYSQEYNLGCVAFNNLSDVEAMIDAIRRWQPIGLRRCLLVNHSTDDSVRSAIGEAAISAGWSYVAQENRGFGAGVNKLVSMSSDSKVLIVVNLDVHFCGEPPFLDMTKAVVRGSYSLVGTSLINEQGLEMAGRLPPFSEELLLWRFRSSKKNKSYPVHLSGKVEKWRGAVHGACFAIETEDFISVGGLDEKLFLYAEEFDLQAKLARFSKQIGFVSSKSIVHHSEGIVNRRNTVLNTYNLRYLAIRERKIFLSLYFTLLLVKILFESNFFNRRSWRMIFQCDINRKELLKQL